MVACCAHHVADVLPLIGLSGAAVFLAQYKIPFMSLGLAMNAVGITVSLRLVRREQVRADLAIASFQDRAIEPGEEKRFIARAPMGYEARLDRTFNQVATELTAAFAGRGFRLVQSFDLRNALGRGRPGNDAGQPVQWSNYGVFMVYPPLRAEQAEDTDMDNNAMSPRLIAIYERDGHTMVKLLGSMPGTNQQDTMEPTAVEFESEVVAILAETNV
jgi:uncharacterized protein (DUF302 family)